MSTLDFKSFDVNEEVIEEIKKHLGAATIDNKDFSIQIQNLDIAIHYGLDWMMSNILV